MCAFSTFAAFTTFASTRRAGATTSGPCATPAASRLSESRRSRAALRERGPAPTKSAWRGSWPTRSSAAATDMRAEVPGNQARITDAHAWTNPPPPPPPPTWPFFLPKVVRPACRRPGPHRCPHCAAHLAGLCMPFEEFTLGCSPLC